jgi:hypothetical protein
VRVSYSVFARTRLTVPFRSAFAISTPSCIQQRHFQRRASTITASIYHQARTLAILSVSLSEVRHLTLHYSIHLISPTTNRSNRFRTTGLHTRTITIRFPINALTFRRRLTIASTSGPDGNPPILRWYVRRGIGGEGSPNVVVNVVLLWTGGQGHARDAWDV